MQKMHGRKPRTQSRVSGITRWKKLRFWILEKSPSFIESPHWTLLGAKDNNTRFSMFSNCGFKATGYRNRLDLHARFYKPKNFSTIDGAAVAESLYCSWLIKESKMVSCVRLMFLRGFLSLGSRNSTLTDLFIFSTRLWVSGGSYLTYLFPSSSEAMLPNELDSINDKWINEFVSPATVSCLFGSASIIDNLSMKLPLNGPCTEKLLSRLTKQHCKCKCLQEMFHVSRYATILLRIDEDLTSW